MRSFRRPLSRRGAIGLGVIGLASTGFLLASPAFAATSYPSWDDVERAKANQSAKAAEVTRIEGLIAQLENDVAQKQALAEQLGLEYQLAQEEFEDAAARAVSLQEQADAEAARAEETAAKLGRLAAQQYRTGGDNTSLELFFSDSAASADDLLARLGTMDQLLAANRSVYAEAVGARDNALNLYAQAAVARDERDRLQQEAEGKMLAAQEAASAAQAALEAQSAHRETLQAQLAALQDTTAKTIADYQAGVEAARKAREEAARKAREEAARKAREEEERRRKAAEEAAKNNSGGSSGGGGGSSSGGGGSPAGEVQNSGWVRPAAGWISSWFGNRGGLCANGYCTGSGHRGIDFAAGCWSPIYAAASGRVVFAANSGSWGNYIKVDHGGGIITGYAHIAPGGFAVSHGQRVSAGQVIAHVGNTGASTGCHLHFEVYSGGVRIDPAPFLRNRGISV
nr:MULTISPECIES: M23 family metallopeptidase [Microbacterium]